MVEAHPSVQILVNPVIECAMALGVVTDATKTYDIGRAWFDAIGARAAPELLTDIRAFSGGSDMVWAHLTGFVIETPTPDMPTFIAVVATLDPLELLRGLVGYYVRYFRRATPPDVIDRAVHGDPAAQREFLRTSYPEDAAWQSALEGLLAQRPETVQARLVAILSRWYAEVFATEEAAILPILMRDAERLRAEQPARAWHELVEMATNGIEYIPEPGIRHILLIPSYVVRPHLHNFEHGDSKIFCYPVAEESIAGDADAPSLRLVRVMKALGDERRLRVLRILASERATLQELANRFGIPKTTMSHHLSLLRAAGLVRVRTSDRRYSLRRDVIPDAFGLLEAYLEQPDRREM